MIAYVCVQIRHERHYTSANVSLDPGRLDLAYYSWLLNHLQPL